ncbi:hypothetical protein FRC02_003970 [Tulasnella sp. 418]|nr:hypothetical protein FRC02_003970 [Tulasnella sp. 418]
MYTAETVAFRRGSTILKLPRSLVYDAVIARLREHFGLVGPVLLYLVNQGSQTLQLPVAESSYDILSRETNAMFDVRGHSTWENPPASSTSGRPPIYMALAPAAPRSIPGVPPNAPLPRPLSRRSPSPFDPPPPYVRQVNSDEQRKVTFTVSTKLGDQMTLSAQRWVKGMKVFEAACKLLKLQVCNHPFMSKRVGPRHVLLGAQVCFKP